MKKLHLQLPGDPLGVSCGFLTENTVGNGKYFLARGFNATQEGHEEEKDFARRLVASFNACEGIPTETLESEIFNHGLLKLSSTANEFARFKSENASLKNAIQEIIGLCQDDDGSACAALDAMDNIYYIRRIATMAIEGITEQDISDTLPDEPTFK